jgi:branched-chain amino acid transport system substrate-binding protein
MRKFFHCTFTVFIFFAVLGCEPEPAVQPSGKSAKIGVIGPMSGPDSSAGLEGLTGVNAVMRMTPLLANGDQIELVVEDDQNDPILTRQALRALVLEHDVAAVLTFSTSGPVLGLASIADTYQTPIIAALATHPAVTKDNGFVNQICFDDVFQGSVAALFVRDELLLDKVAIISDPSSNYSSNLAAEFERKYTAIGGEVIEQIFITSDAEKLAHDIKALHERRPELLYLPTDAANVIRVVEQTRKLVWEPLFMSSDVLMPGVVTHHPEAKPLLEGVMVTDFFHYKMPLTPFGKKVKPHVKNLKTNYGVLGIESLAILINAMNNCRPADDRHCINDRIRSTSGFTGVSGKITIDSHGRAARPLVINTIEGGRLRFMVKVF